MKTHKIRVIYDVHREVVRTADPADINSMDSTRAEWQVVGFRVPREGMDYNHFEVAFEPKFEVTYYLVVVEYKTQSKFCTTENLIEFVDLFKNLETAVDCVKSISEGDEFNLPFTYTAESEQDLYLREGVVGSWQDSDAELTSIKIIDVRLKR